MCARLRVAERVLQRLLRDAQHLAVARRRRAGSSSSSVELDLALLEPPQHLDVLAQRAAEPVALEVGRAQLEDQRAQLLERLLRERPQLRDLARAPPPGRARAASPPPRRSRTSPNSFWLTASCSSSASRLRSARIESSRLRS